MDELEEIGEKDIEEVISFLREINKPVCIAIRYWYVNSLRWLMKDYAKRKDVRLFEVLESIVDVEETYAELKRAINVLKPLTWALGKDVFDKANKICAKYDVLWGKLLFALVSEDFERTKIIASGLREFKPILENMLSEIEDKVKRL